MNRSEQRQRRIALAVWKRINPVARRLAPYAPWWVVLETTGNKSGLPRRIPLARGPIDGDTAWIASVHGEHSSFARNIAANPRVRLQIGRRWRTGTATIVPVDPAMAKRFNLYARANTGRVGIDPKLIRIDLDPVT